jgi:type I restriction enzyme, S subunit
MSPHLALGEICSTLKETTSPATLSDSHVWYASIPAFDETGAPELVRPNTIGSNKILLTKPCILFSRLNPRIPRVWDFTSLPPGHRLLGSTEFVPFVIEDPSRLEGRYLYWFLQSKRFIAKARAGVEAATKSRERVEKERLFAIPIPLPSPAQQRLIAAVLDKADGIRRKRRESLGLLDEFLPSAFLEMFGDPVRNERGWEVVRLGSIGDVQGGLQVTATRASRPRQVPYLRVANVYRDRLDLSEVKNLGVTDGEVGRTRLQSGDLLIVEGHGNPEEIGRSAVWDASIDPCTHQNHLIRVRLDVTRAEPHYCSAFLNSSGGRQQLFRFGKTTSGLNTISTGNVKAVEMMLPPVVDQGGYSQLRAHVLASGDRIRAAQRETEALFDSLAQRAFRGEL